MEKTEEKSIISFKKKFTEDQKMKILKEMEKGLITQSELAIRYGIHPMTIYKWRRQLNHLFEKEEDINLQEILKELEKTKEENKILKTLVANKSIENEILQTANTWLKKTAESRRQKRQKQR